MPDPKKQILILGGGFAGVKAAQSLLAENLKNHQITLITNNPNFEYHAALYRVVTGRSPKQVTVPLKSIFNSKKINIVIDRITSLDLKKQQISGDSKTNYSYDYLILAPGSQTAFYDIPGIRKNAFQLKNLADALKLKAHLDDMVGASKLDPKNCLHVAIVGGGATGVELAGEIGGYMKNQICKHKMNCECLQVDLLECGPKILNSFGKKTSIIASRRLKSLGVNVKECVHITKENPHGLLTDKGAIGSKTVIWVAGITGHALFKNHPNFKLSPNHKVQLTPNLSLPSFPNVFVAGDNAATPDSGNALSALSHGHFIAGEIISAYYGYPQSKYSPISASWAIPIGPKWAISKLGPFIFTGPLGWFIRKTIDLWFFSTILPFPKALKAVTIK